jgi:glutathione S-transferase
VVRTSKKFGKEILDRPFIALWYKKQTGWNDHDISNTR